MVVGKVERNIICDLHNEERTKGRWLRQAENLRQEGCRLLLVPYPDDRVVQLHSHVIDATSCGWIARAWFTCPASGRLRVTSYATIPKGL